MSSTIGYDLAPRLLSYVSEKALQKFLWRKLLNHQSLSLTFPDVLKFSLVDAVTVPRRSQCLFISDQIHAGDVM